MVKVHLTISLEHDAYETLYNLSKGLGVSKSTVVNFMLKNPANAYLLHLFAHFLRILKNENDCGGI